MHKLCIIIHKFNIYIYYVHCRITLFIMHSMTVIYMCSKRYINDTQYSRDGYLSALSHSNKEGLESSQQLICDCFFLGILDSFLEWLDSCLHCLLSCDL